MSLFFYSKLHFYIYDILYIYIYACSNCWNTVTCPRNDGSCWHKTCFFCCHHLEGQTVVLTVLEVNYSSKYLLANTLLGLCYFDSVSGKMWFISWLLLIFSKLHDTIVE